jgi:ribosomal protein S27E
MAPACERTSLLVQVTDDAPYGEEFSAVMTIACPLCENLNEVLSQPSSIRWKQVSCSACEANLVLVRDASSITARHPLKSVVRLKPASSGTRQFWASVRSRLFIVVAMAVALGVPGYLSFEAGLFSNNQMLVESSVRPSTTPPPSSSRVSPTVSQPSLSTVEGSVKK